MAIEKSWSSVAPTLFTADGGAQGQIQVASTNGLKVKQRIVISAVSLPDLQVQVKRVISPTSILVGLLNPPQGQQGLGGRANLSAYTVALGAFLYAEEQPKSLLKPDDIIQAVYDQEPACAIRVDLVDQLGNYYETANPLPVKLTDGSINIETINAELRVQLSAKDNDPKPGDIHSSVRIGDGTNEAKVNADGSFNVNVVTTPVSNQSVKIQYNEILAVASGATTSVVLYTVPVGKTAILQRISVSGENIAKYDILYNSAAIATKRTYFGGALNADFDFPIYGSSGLILSAGDVVKVQVNHSRPMIANFEANIQVVEIT